MHHSNIFIKWISRREYFFKCQSKRKNKTNQAQVFRSFFVDLVVIFTFIIKKTKTKKQNSIDFKQGRVEKKNIMFGHQMKKKLIVILTLYVIYLRFSTLTSVQTKKFKKLDKK